MHACKHACCKHAAYNMHAARCTHAAARMQACMQACKRATMHACMLHAYCMHGAHMLHTCCMHGAHMLHTCCMHAACMLHAYCKHARFWFACVGYLQLPPVAVFLAEDLSFLLAVEIAVHHHSRRACTCSVADGLQHRRRIHNRTYSA